METGEQWNNIFKIWSNKTNMKKLTLTSLSRLGIIRDVSPPLTSGSFCISLIACNISFIPSSSCLFSSTNSFTKRTYFSHSVNTFFTIYAILYKKQIFTYRKNTHLESTNVNKCTKKFKNPVWIVELNDTPIKSCAHIYTHTFIRSWKKEIMNVHCLHFIKNLLNLFFKLHFY